MLGIEIAVYSVAAVIAVESTCLFFEYQIRALPVIPVGVGRQCVAVDAAQMPCPVCEVRRRNSG